MAVDYYHRLVVSGPPTEVRAFRRAVGRTVAREGVGPRQAWREHVPLSFAALYALCPELTRVAPEPPFDPYDLSRWPTRSHPDGRAELRYQLHTRNLELRDLMVPLSRRVRGLVFVLVTFCLDDASIESYLITQGRVRRYTLPERRHDWHWAQAGRRFRLTGDALYEHEDARTFAEDGMLDEALDHWTQRIGAAWQKRLGARARTRPAAAGRGPAGRPSRAAAPQGGPRRKWWNRPPVRDLQFEQLVFMTRSRGEVEAGVRRPARAAMKLTL